jgi:hypothetical protein
MIVDCHCHAGKGDKLTAPWNTDAAIEPYLRRARAAGIDKTLVSLRSIPITQLETLK